HAHGLALSAVHSLGAIPFAVDTRGLKPFAAELAGAVGDQKGRNYELAGSQRPNVGANGFHDPDELVAHAATGWTRRHAPVRPEIAPADRGTRDADDRVGWF